MKLRLSALAKQDLVEAVAYYNEQRAGLGYEFAAEVQRAFRHIEKYPDAFSVFSKYTRRCLVDRFPYGILYAAEGESIQVLNIMHLHRDPIHWRSRLGN